MWVFNKKNMGMRRSGLACLSLLLLILIELEAPCLVDGFNKFKAGSGSSLNSLKTHKAFSGNADHKDVFYDGDGDDDDIFGGDKRKVNTGPNPLHNR